MCGNTASLVSWHAEKISSLVEMLRATRPVFLGLTAPVGALIGAPPLPGSCAVVRFAADPLFQCFKDPMVEGEAFFNGRNSDSRARMLSRSDWKPLAHSHIHLKSLSTAMWDCPSRNPSSRGLTERICLLSSQHALCQALVGLLRGGRQLPGRGAAGHAGGAGCLPDVGAL